MSKRSIAAVLRSRYGLSWSEANNITQTLFLSICKSLRQDKLVILHGFGTFSVEKFKAKRYRDIKTGKIRTKGVVNRVRFKPSKNILKP